MVVNKMCIRRDGDNAFLPSANEVCKGYVFTRVCHSVQGGGDVSWPIPRGEVERYGQGGLQAHTQGGGWGVLAGGSPDPYLGGRLRGLAKGFFGSIPGGEVGGLARGISRPRPVGESRLRWGGGCIPACTEADPPPPWSRWLLLWTVHILLECILVLLSSLLKVSFSMTYTDVWNFIL